MLNTLIVPMPPFVSPKLFLEVLFFFFFTIFCTGVSVFLSIQLLM